MKKLLFFLSFLLFSFQFTFAKPKVVVQKKQTQVQRVGEYIRFITPEIIDSTMCYPPDPKCNYLNRHERLKYDEYLIKNKSGIFVPDSVMLLAYSKRNNPEIFSFNEKLRNFKLFGFLKQKTEIIKTNIVFVDKEVLIQRDLYLEEKFSWFYAVYFIGLLILSLSFLEIIDFLNFYLGRILLVFCIAGAIIFYNQLPDYSSLDQKTNIVFLAMQLLLTVFWLIIRFFGVDEYNRIPYYVLSILTILSSCIFLPINVFIIILLFPISFYLYRKKLYKSYIKQIG